MFDKNQRIFIQIPAYRDSELEATIDSLFANAKNKHLLDLWVCWQHDKCDVPPSSVSSNERVNIIDFDYRPQRKRRTYAHKIAEAVFTGANLQDINR